MKKMLLFATCLLAFLSLYSQTKVDESRRTKFPGFFQEYNRNAKQPRVDVASNPVLQSIDANSTFTITDETTLTEYYIVYFWEWTKDQNKKEAINLEADKSTIKFFVIPKKDLDIVSVKIYRRWSPTVGALTFPFKYRPQGGKFETTFALGVAGGVTWNPGRLNKHTFSALLGVAASSALVDQYSTDPVANITEQSERTAITFSGSFVYQWERLQVGFSVGIDNLLDNEVLKWQYQSKPWLSLGIGISLFTANEVTVAGSN